MRRYSNSNFISFWRCKSLFEFRWWLIGGSGHQNIKNAAIAFIDKAGNFLDKTSKTDTTPLPNKNCIKFYFLTNNGIFVGQEQMINIENSSSKWLDLFEESNKVISEIRIVTNDKL